VLPVANFTSDSSRIDGLSVRCKSCNNKKNREYQYRAFYGISIEQYEEMLDKQNGLCAICKTPPQTKRLAVDHDHDTGEVRGLLCHRCNRAVEWFIYYKNIASEYLERTNENNLI